MKRAKIVATIGPASESVEEIGKLIKAGVNVFRLNFSHGDYETHRRVYENIRKAEKKAGAHIAVMQDLQGPKIRVGEIDGGSMELKARARVTITTRDVKGAWGVIPTIYKPFARDVKPGGRILLDDGLMELKAVSSSGGDVECVVVKGGTLKEHKGINLPGADISAACLTAKDAADLEFGLKLGVDFVALSFVRSGGCVKSLKRKIGKRLADVRVIAKIERPEAVKNIEEILKEADGVMVARGDLGVELPPEKVPGIQKRIIERANARGRIVITATQMLESMISNPRPTRAEANDVANAVLDGTDAVMLSGETAVGAYPVEAVEMMSRIIVETERRIDERASAASQSRPADGGEFTIAVAHSAVRAADDTAAKAIVAFTQSGDTARHIARFRPAHLILGATLDEKIARRMSLTWGTLPVLFDKVCDIKTLVASVDAKLLSARLVKRGDVVIITFGVPVGKSGSTDLIRIHRVGKKG